MKISIVRVAISATCAVYFGTAPPVFANEPPAAAEANPPEGIVVPVEIQQRIASNTLRRLHWLKTDLPTTGNQIGSLKAIDVGANATVAWTWDKVGNLLDDQGKALAKLERESYAADYGAISLELWARMQSAAPDTRLHVLCWLATYEELLRKEELLANTKLQAAHDAKLTVLQTAAREKLWASAPDLVSHFQVLSRVPAVSADLTPDEIVQIAKLEVIATLLPAGDNHNTSSTVYVDAVNGSVATTGYSGSGIKVCIIDKFSPTNPNSTLTYTAKCSGTTHDHTKCMMSMVNINYSPYGTAADSSVYSANWDGCGGGASEELAVQWCANTAQAAIWAVGQSCDGGDIRLFDYWVKEAPYPLISAPTDQTDYGAVNCNTACGASPGTSSCASGSVLVVGGSRDCGTATRSSHLAYCAAHTTNVAGDHETPNVVAPAYDLLVDSNSFICGNGTSWASGITAGVVAQFAEQNSNLIGWPEALRAITMATAGESVDGGVLDLADNVDDRDGAGEIDAEMGGRLAAASNKVDGGNTAVERGFDYGSISNADPVAGHFYSEVYHMKTVSTAQRMRIVLTWDASATCSDPTDKTTCSGSGPDADLDLYVYKNGNLFAYSGSSLNTFEFIEFAATANDTYDIKIQAYSWTATGTYFSLAFNTGAYSTN